jgi:DNA-directed RNA polymerase alpha subunit
MAEEAPGSAIKERSQMNKSGHDQPRTELDAIAIVAMSAVIAQTSTPLNAELVASRSYAIAKSMLNQRSRHAKVAARVPEADKIRGVPPGQASIDHLLLSNRTAHCLLAEGISTIEDLVTRTKSDLRRIPGFGPTCMRDLLAQLNKTHYRLKP